MRYLVIADSRDSLNAPAPCFSGYSPVNIRAQLCAYAYTYAIEDKLIFDDLITRGFDRFAPLLCDYLSPSRGFSCPNLVVNEALYVLRGV